MVNLVLINRKLRQLTGPRLNIQYHLLDGDDQTLLCLQIAFVGSVSVHLKYCVISDERKIRRRIPHDYIWLHHVHSGDQQILTVD